MPQNEPKTPIIVCGDDYGLSIGIGRGIRELLAAQRISATSCITVSDIWPDEGKKLRNVDGIFDIGIHLTLTDFTPLGDMPRIAPNGILPSFRTLLIKDLFGHLDCNEIAVQFERQIEEFRSVIGRYPEFIDGHHHIHQLSECRTALRKVLGSRGVNWRPYIRVASDDVGIILIRRVSVLKSLAISHYGRNLRQMAKRLGYKTNSGFSGIYDFSVRSDYARTFSRFLIGTKPNSIIMCHPGYAGADLARIDSVVEQREAELQFLLSKEYIALVNQASVQVGVFNDQLS